MKRKTGKSLIYMLKKNHDEDNIFQNRMSERIKKNTEYFYARLVVFLYAPPRHHAWHIMLSFSSLEPTFLLISTEKREALIVAAVFCRVLIGLKDKRISLLRVFYCLFNQSERVKKWLQPDYLVSRCWPKETQALGKRLSQSVLKAVYPTFSRTRQRASETATIKNRLKNEVKRK